MPQFKQEPSSYLLKKPRFKDYYPIAFDLINSNQFISVLDVGCASGDFLELIPYSNVKCIGIDTSEELIKFAKSRNTNKNINYKCGNILNKNFEFKIEIQFVTIFGTALTIDNLQLLIDKVMLFNPKLIMLNDVVNVNDIDVICGYKRNINDEFNFPYNIRSFSTWEQVLNNYENYSISFEPYKYGHTIKPWK
ncbi:MAG: class I SAM-dependent methyltransferase [Parvicellaceae bacterium]